MPRVGRARLFAFLVAGVYAAICISPVSVPIGAATTMANARDGEGAGTEARFLRGCIDLRPAGRPTARRRTNRDGFCAGQLAFVLVRLFGYGACPESVSPRGDGRGRRVGGRERRPTTLARFELFLAVV